jgi:hypothetical protein
MALCASHDTWDAKSDYKNYPKECIGLTGLLFDVCLLLRAISTEKLIVNAISWVIIACCILLGVQSLGGI